MTRIRIATAAFALLFGASAAQAQVVVGTVRDSASTLPVPGAVVLLLGAQGDTLQRGLANQFGVFRVVATGGVRLRVLRLGFLPLEVALVPGEEASRLDLRMERLPTLLAPMHVRREAACSRRDDRAAAFGLWEQARTALFASIVARSASPLETRRVRYEQVVRGDGDFVAQHRVRIDRTVDTTDAFASHYSVRDFVEKGFARLNGGDFIYHGPDARVILDGEFVLNFCLALAPAQRDRPNQVGVAFTPAQGRREVVTIEGVIWVDTARRMLDEIAFDYRGLPNFLQAGRPGGRVSYLEHTNGIVMVDRWYLRLVGTRPDTAPRGGLLRDVRQVSKVGGELAQILWPDGTIWIAPLGEFVGFALHRGGKPAAGVELELEETDYRALVDSAGAFDIRDLLPGPYRLMVVDPRLLPIDLIIPTDYRFTAKRNAMHSAVLTIPSAEEFIRGRCREAGGEGTRGDAFVIGRVVDATGTPVRGAVVSLYLPEPAQPVRVVARIVTASDGLFQWCDARLKAGGRMRLDILVEGAAPVQYSHVTSTSLTVVRVELPRS